MEAERVDSDAASADDLDALYRSHFRMLMRVAYLLTGSNARAEDAVHDSFIRCAPRLSAVDNPAAYLRTAVVNECRRQFRLQARTVNRPTTDRTELLPVELVELRDALSRLDERKRTAVVLRYFVDVPDSEIAEILDCRPTTVRTLLHRAVSQLREELS